MQGAKEFGTGQSTTDLKSVIIIDVATVGPGNRDANATVRHPGVGLARIGILLINTCRVSGAPQDLDGNRRRRRAKRLSFVEY